MDAFCIHNARKMRTNFSLVYASPCTFKCPIKITRQSSNSCDAGKSPETRWRTPCRSVGRTSTSLHDVGDAAKTSTAASPPPRVTFLSLHSWDQRKPTFRYIISAYMRKLEGQCPSVTQLVTPFTPIRLQSW